MESQRLIRRDNYNDIKDQDFKASLEMSPTPNNGNYTNATKENLFDEVLANIKVSPRDENKENLALLPNDQHYPIVQHQIAEAVPSRSLETFNTTITMPSNEKKIPNLVSQWLPRKPTLTHTGAIAKSGHPAPPHAYQFMDIYRKKREDSLRRQQEEEQKMREFHSRPAPNFNAIHKNMERRHVFALTVPVTPKVLKNSRESEERRKKRLEELRLRHQSNNELHSQKAEALAPTKERMEQVPFTLHAEKRLKERRQFDMEVQKTIELKHKKEEEERIRQEKEEVKTFRKLATFKARPNPFK